jgi:hypothetical protein
VTDLSIAAAALLLVSAGLIAIGVAVALDVRDVIAELEVDDGEEY